MKIVNPGHELISRGYHSPAKFLEGIGRVCYKSEDKITDTSAKDFVQMLIRRGHTAMLEHYWVHLTFATRIMGNDFEEVLREMRSILRNNNLPYLDKFLEITRTSGQTFVSFPIRVVVDFVRICGKMSLRLNSFLSVFEDIYPDLFPCFTSLGCVTYPGHYAYYVEDDENTFSNSIRKMMTLDNADPEDIDHEIMRHCTHTVRFICDRGVSHELVRHRLCSFAQESTRYCNYSKDKYNNEISVIKPVFESDLYSEPYLNLAWEKSCQVAEQQYLELIDSGVSPQMARSILPTCLKTEIVMTANEIEWQHIVNLRAKGTSGTPHPQMVEIMTPWYQELCKISRGRIK